EWLVCTDPDLMLEHLIGKLTTAQLSRYIRACWHHVAPEQDVLGPNGKLGGDHALECMSQWDAVRFTAESVLQASRRASSFWQERCHQAAFLRHIVGNPFRPLPAPVQFTSDVLRLAEAVSRGEDCSFALHDTLIETGYPDLAEHFQQ